MIAENEAVKSAAGLIAQHFFTESELAAELGKNIRTLRRWHALRIGPPVTRAGGKTILYSKQSVLAWLQSKEQRHCREPRSRAKRISARPRARQSRNVVALEAARG
jgi:DNA-binding transcriptional MerR regulator